MLSVAVLISGRGSNLLSLLKSARSYQVSAVLSDREDAAGLTYAKQFDVPVYTFPRAQYQSRSAQKLAIYSALDQLNPGLVALAGFMQIVEAEYVHRMFGRIINIHPSLLPAFPGLDTHRRALGAKVSCHGCSVHFVDSGIDTGPIIAQARCGVTTSDSEEVLEARVLALEHALYPWVVESFARGDFTLTGRNIRWSNAAQAEATQRGFLLAAGERP